MAEIHGQEYEVIAKEITIALIQKSTFASDRLLEYACESYDKIFKQLIETYRDTHK